MIIKIGPITVNSNDDLNPLVEHVNGQLLRFFGVTESVQPYMSKTVNSIENCFQHTTNKYYHDESGDTVFSVFQASQYTIFLYFLSKVINQSFNNRYIADAVYYLNRTLNGVDMYYEVDLPNVFTLDHPLGSVIGRAHYGEYFAFSQGCTVGNNKGIYPVIHENVVMHSNSKILGNCEIGSNVVISANSYIKDQSIPDGSIVFGQSPNLIVKKIRQENYSSYFFNFQ